ncbi:Replication protein E1, partial [Clarias magur]
TLLLTDWRALLLGISLAPAWPPPPQRCFWGSASLQLGHPLHDDASCLCQPSSPALRSPAAALHWRTRPGFSLN